MELFEAVKALYGGSQDDYLLCDAGLNVIWKNHEHLPDRIDKGLIKTYPAGTFALPVEATATYGYKGKFADSTALRIEPLRNGGDIVGYLVRIYDCEDIETLSDKTGYAEFKANFLGNIRLELSQIVAMLDSQRADYESRGDIGYLNFDKQARNNILKVFASTVNMNELSKYYSGYFTTEYQSLSDIVSDVCDEEGALLEESGCQFSFEVAPCVYFEVNKDRLKNVLANLLINAFMYNPKDEKSVRLELALVDDEILISVEDNGVGIAPEVWQAAQTPFGTFSEYSGKEALGIALAKCFCDKFGGKLQCESEENKGTKVTITLPKDERGVPKEFRVGRMPSIPNPYDSRHSIMAKGLEPFK